MKIYLAARYSRFPKMQVYAKELADQGHTVTSRWILGDHDLSAHAPATVEQCMPLWAQEDWDDVAAAEVCISFTEPPETVPGRARGGRHVEWGIALALKKRCIAVGYRENVFHWLPSVEYYASWSTCLASLAMASGTERQESAPAERPGSGRTDTRACDHNPVCKGYSVWQGSIVAR